MTLRTLRCRACRTTFMAEDDPAVARVPCPKCGAVVATAPAPEPAPVAPAAPGSDASVFVPADGDRRRRRRRNVLLLGLTALAVVAVAGAVARPWLTRRPVKPGPADPVVAAATDYLRAISTGDTQAAQRLGTVELPPAIRSFRAPGRDPAADLTLKGSFAPIAALHARIDEKYEMDAASGRYTPRDALGPAAEVLDTLHAAKAKAEKDGIYRKMQSGDPDDIFDAAEGLGKALSGLAEGALAPKKLVPSYKQLVEDASPPLPAPERSLALDVAERRPAWDALLSRPFATIKADGPFVLERAEVVAPVVDALASAGDPPTTLRLGLTRFRLEGIDTGWRVTSTRRVTPGESQETPRSPTSQNSR